MRQIISTAVVAVIVGAVAGATMGAVAQSGPAATTEQVISPATVSNINAHKVDGRHAVGSGASKAKRAGKLVATSSSGYLPSNIVKPYWGAIRNKPAGFADGVDNVGYVSKVHPKVYTIGNSPIWVYANVPLNSDVEMTLIPTRTGVQLEIAIETYRRYNSTILTHWYNVKKISGGDAADFRVRTRVFNQGISAVGLANVAKKVKVGVAKNRRD